MAIIAAVNQADMLVMLQDGRVLPITGLYASPGPWMLTTESKLNDDMKIDEWEIAEVFTVGFPDQPGIVLICSVADVSLSGAAN